MATKQSLLKEILDAAQEAKTIGAEGTDRFLALMAGYDSRINARMGPNNIGISQEQILQMVSAAAVMVLALSPDLLRYTDSQALEDKVRTASLLNGAALMGMKLMGLAIWEEAQTYGDEAEPAARAKVDA